MEVTYASLCAAMVAARSFRGRVASDIAAAVVLPDLVFETSTVTSLIIWCTFCLVMWVLSPLASMETLEFAEAVACVLVA